MNHKDLHRDNYFYQSACLIEYFDMKVKIGIHKLPLPEGIGELVGYNHSTKR